MERMDKLKQYELVILEEIDRICKKYDIKYYLAFGSALGAIRHKGFIPWDDDIDIHMMYSDLEKFKEVCKKELSDKFYFQDKFTDRYYYNYWAKVGMEDTTWMPKDRIVDCKYGICVDIFPLFPLLNNKKNKKRIEKYSKLLLVTTAKYYVLNTKKKKYSKIKKLIHKLVPHKLNNYLCKYALRKLDMDIDNYDTIVVCDTDNDRNVFFEKDVIVGNKNLDFEDKKLPVPNKIDEYLTMFYGDYMVLPKEEDRYGHDTGDDIIYDFDNSYKKYLGD